MYWWQNPLHPDLGSPMLQRCLRNQKLLNQPPRVTSFEFEKESPCSIKGYTLQEGMAHAWKYDGEVTDEDLQQVTTKLPVCKMTYPKDDFWIIWEPHCEESCAHITVEHMGIKNAFVLAKHLKNVGKIIFDEQQHEIATARADVPTNDTGTWSSDRRKEEVGWLRADGGSRGKISRLMRFWCSYENVIPQAILQHGAGADRIVWLGPKRIAQLTQEDKRAINELMPHDNRWRLQ